MLKSFAAVTIVVAGFVPNAGRASPAATLAVSAPTSIVIEVYDGCGVYGHRGPYGACRAGGQAGGYAPGYSCPPGWHVGPYGRRCWRN